MPITVPFLARRRFIFSASAAGGGLAAGAILYSGDAQTNGDNVLFTGDAQDGTDVLLESSGYPDPVDTDGGLLTAPSDFTDAAWSKTRLNATANQATDPFDTTLADELAEDSGTGGHYASQVISGANQQLAFTASVYIKENTRKRALVSLNGSSDPNSYYNVTVNLQKGRIDSEAVGPNTTLNYRTITDYGSGWYRVILSVTQLNSSAGSGAELWIGPLNGNAVASAFSYTGDGSSSVYVYGAELVQATEPQA